MSRIGQKPVNIPDDVDVTVSGSDVTVSGSNGELTREVPSEVSVSVDSDEGHVVVERNLDTQEAKAIHGTTRSLIQNMVTGAGDGFNKALEIHGTGYDAKMQGDTLVLSVGYTNEVEVDVPDGLEVEVPNNKLIEISGSKKQEVGQFAAEVRSVRPPEPYNQKGIRYRGEQVRSKEGKKFVSGV